MTAAERSQDFPDDSPALKAALGLLEQGLWPVPITSPDDARHWVLAPGKQPASGKGWGKVRYDPEMLRAFYSANPKAGVGIKLGKAGGVVDIEVDDPEAGEETFTRLLGGECVETKGWTSARGHHSLFLWDDRLAKYGVGVIEKDSDFPGIGIRLGAADPDSRDQIQSVCPPSPMTYKDGDRIVAGPPREWNGIETIARLPDVFFSGLDRILGRRQKPPANQPASSTPNVLVRQRYGLAALDREIKALQTSPEGERNNQLNRSAFVLGQLVASGCLDRPAVESVLAEVAQRVGLGDREIKATIRSGIISGMDEPRDISHVGTNQGNGNSVNCNNFADVSKVRKVGGSPEDSTYDTSAELNQLTEIEWEPPRLWESLPSEAFPLDVLPSSLSLLCQEASVSMQCPVDYFGVSALGLAGAVIGLSVNLAVKSSWIEGPNLYVAIVGPPGTKKSPAIRLMARPLTNIDRDLREAYRDEKAVFEEEHRAFEAQKKKGGGGSPPATPIPQQLTMDDATREAVAQVHSENHRGLVLIKDELSGWVASLNAYRAGKGDDKQFWLSVNSGSLVKVNRKGSREPLIIPRPCIAIVGALTPSMLPAMRADQADDGWLDRLLFSYPEPVYPDGWVESDISAELIEEWSDAVGRLWQRPMVHDEAGRLRPFFIHMTPKAKALWVEWFNSHCAEKADPEFPRSLHGPWSKLEGFTARLALILSQLHQAYDPTNDRPPRDIEALDIWGARKLCDYFKAHYRRAKADLSRRSQVPEEAESILRWIARHQKTEFSGRDITRQFTRFDDHERDAALSWLLARHCIRERPALPRPPGMRGRHPSTVYEVNPYLGHVSKIDVIDEKTGESVSPVALTDASGWLEGYLFKESAVVGDILTAAVGAGYSEAVIRTAALSLGIETVVVEGVERWRLRGSS